MADESPTPATTPATIVPFVSSFLAIAKGRKGLVLIVFATIVYLRNPTRLTQILAFLGVVVPAYFASSTGADEPQDVRGS
jgi:uncharacterized protein (DUF486 family)